MFKKVPDKFRYVCSLVIFYVTILELFNYKVQRGPAMNTRTHYEVLGVAKTATVEEIKKAYRTLAVKIHPDKGEEKDREKNKKEFCMVHDAYELLMDTVKRAEYDKSLAAESESKQTVTEPTSETRTRFKEYKAAASYQSRQSRDSYNALFYAILNNRFDLLSAIQKDINNNNKSDANDYDPYHINIVYKMNKS